MIEVDKEIQETPIQSISSNSNDNNLRVNKDNTQENTVKSKITKLYCSACSVKCTVESFMSHLTSAHKLRNPQESFSTFGRPVLLPEYRFLLPKKLENTINGDDKVWDYYCEQCNINHSSKKILKMHLENHHKIAPNLDKNCSDLCCAACATALTSINSIVGNLNCTRSKSNSEITSTTSEIDSDTEDSTTLTLNNLSSCIRPTNLTSNNEASTPADSAPYHSKRMITYEGPLTPARYIPSNLTELVRDNKLSTSIRSMLDPPAVKPELLPDKDDPNYFCRVCDKKYRNVAAYRIHLIRVHNMRKPDWKTKHILHPDILPDIKNKDLFCAACEEYFRNPKTFACHIAHVHSISIPYNEIPKIKDNKKIEWLKNTMQKKKSRAPFNPSVLPCVKDPLFYCARCDRRYLLKDYYIKHLQKIHKFRIHKDDCDFSNNSTWCCLLCTKSLPDQDSCNAHVRLIHNFTLAPHSNISDFTCYLCKKEYKSTMDVTNHLTHIHGIQPTVKLENRHELPSSLSLPLRSQVINTFYSKRGEASVSRRIYHECFMCGRRFASKYELGCHKKDHHDVHFIYNDAELLCNLCDSAFISKYTYRAHLKGIHLIDELPPLSDLESVVSYTTCQPRDTRAKKKKNDTDVKIKTEANPNEDTFNRSTNVYCAICDLTYSTTVHYQLHCFKYHKSG